MVADGVSAARLKLHTSSIKGFKIQKSKCRKRCQRLTMMGHPAGFRPRRLEDWSGSRRAARFSPNNQPGNASSFIRQDGARDGRRERAIPFLFQGLGNNAKGFVRKSKLHEALCVNMGGIREQAEGFQTKQKCDAKLEKNYTKRFALYYK
jgi:hypothetical protein